MYFEYWNLCQRLETNLLSTAIETLQSRELKDLFELPEKNGNRSKKKESTVYWNNQYKF